MSNEHIDLEMKPDIVVKASPTLQKIDAKAVAGVTVEDIIERNVIAEYREPQGGDEPETGQESETDV